MSYPRLRTCDRSSDRNEAPTPAMDKSDLITLRMGALSVRDKIPEKAHVLVDTTEALKSALDDMRNDKVFALDCEGVNLGR